VQAVETLAMKITAVETIRLREFGNLIWVRIYTDGLGCAEESRVYFGDLYASSRRLRSGMSSRMRRPIDVSACSRAGDCGARS
jgi:hypothetical protein